VRSRQLELFGRVYRIALIACVFSDRLPSPAGQTIQRLIVFAESDEVEGQLAPNDKLFQELASHQLVFSRVLLGRQRHVQR
jgi:hypothetical protein